MLSSSYLWFSYLILLMHMTGIDSDPTTRCQPIPIISRWVCGSILQAAVLQVLPSCKLPSCKLTCPHTYSHTPFLWQWTLPFPQKQLLKSLMHL